LFIQDGPPFLKIKFSERQRHLQPAKISKSEIKERGEWGIIPAPLFFHPLGYNHEIPGDFETWFAAMSRHTLYHYSRLWD
jgi:hypothetical protein